MWIRLTNMCEDCISMVFTAAFTWSKNLHSHRITLGKSGFPCRTEGRLLTICPCDFFRYIIYIVLLTFVINFFHFFHFFCVCLFSPLLRNTLRNSLIKLCYSFMNKRPSPFYTVLLTL